MARRRPLIADQRVAAVLGVASLVTGWVLIHDAYERRGKDQPLILRPFTWWR